MLKQNLSPQNHQSRWLDKFFSEEMIEKRPSNIVLITPEMAKKWLDKSTTKNRPATEKSIKKFVRIMERGEWRVNPSEPISFTEEGDIVNGHHRLEAVIKANMPVSMAVVWDAQKDDFDVIDTGKKRSMGEIFFIDGITNAKSMASIVSHYVNIRDGLTLSMSGDGGIHNTLDLAMDYLDEYYSSHKLYDEVCRFARNIVIGHPKMLPVSDIGGIIMFLIKQKKHDKEKVLNFFDALYNGGGSYPYLQDLGTTLNNDNYADKKMRASRRQSLVAKAWNMFLHNSTARKVRVHMGEIVDFE